MNTHADFYSNPVIQAIAGIPRWTVSDSEKVPINMRELMSTGRIWGAHEVSDECLVTLPELTGFLPNAANHAYHLNAQIDGFVVLDIEKTCPPEIAAELLQLPNLYAELSMSGKGHHLVMPLPTNFWDYPIATAKKKLQERHGWYEVLLHHWVTFTRRVTPPVVPTHDLVLAETLSAENLAVNISPSSTITADTELRPWEALYASLAELAVETPVVAFDMTGSRPDVPRIDQIIDLMTRRGLDKTIDDFHGDHSRFEFSVLGILYNRLAPIMVAIQSAEPDAVYDESVKAWLVYEAAAQLLPYREKHDETRNGLPLLLNAATDLVSRRLGDELAKQS